MTDADIASKLLHWRDRLSRAGVPADDLTDQQVVASPAIHDDLSAKVRILARCTFLPGSWDKRFVRDAGSETHEYPFSLRQAVVVERLWRKYRRQAGNLMRKHGKPVGLLDATPIPEGTR